MLSYDASALVKSVTADLLHELLAVYLAQDAYTIMSIATLRVIMPSITADRISSHYRRNFVCKDYPGAPLSSDSVNRLLQGIGQDSSRRKMFYQKRTETVASDHHIAINVTLKQDSSKVSDLSAFSYKTGFKGCKGGSLLYGYDIETMEPRSVPKYFPATALI